MSGLFIRHGLVIPDAELEERFIQSSGPGGQNVNKVASAVQLSFDVRRSSALSEAARAAILGLADTRLDKDGILTITARRFREQVRNRADARARLAALILTATTPEKPRRATRPTLASKRRRVESKNRQSRIKKNREKPRFSD
ncbi:MAG TPA: alternative ribosome rescue aminoacyl-tRNA hydrolase ArfB [Rhizomicrobium sp.]